MTILKSSLKYWFGALLLGLSLKAMAAPIRVLIDPGHGGSDQGAVRAGIKEAQIALSVSQKLKKILDQDQMFQASLTRDRDVHLSLEERVLLVQQKNADLLVSIHANAASDTRAKGLEIYFQNHLPADEDALMLANLENQNRDSHMTASESEPTKTNDITSIIDDLKRNYKMLASHQLSQNIFQSWDFHKSNLIRQAPFFVISKSEVPAVLIELGYVSNPKELAKLSNSKFQTEMAQKIYAGIRGFALQKLSFQSQSTVASP